MILTKNARSHANHGDDGSHSPIHNFPESLSRALTPPVTAGQHGSMILKPKKKLTPKDVVGVQSAIDHNGWHVPLSKILDVSPDKVRDWEKHGAPSGVAADLWLSLGAKRDNLAAAMFDILIDEPLKPWERGGRLLSEYEGLSDDPTMIYDGTDENGNRDMVVRAIADLLHYCMDQMTKQRIFIDLDSVIKDAIAMYRTDPEHSATPVKSERVRPGALIPYVLTVDPAKISNFQKEFGISQDAAVDVLIENTDWGAEDLPHLLGKKGEPGERLRELRRILREAGQTE